jgi:hypothetical protein
MTREEFREEHFGNIFDDSEVFLEDLDSVIQSELPRPSDEDIENESETPNELEPVIALITHQGDLGKNEWYEVVYFLKKWCSYSGSKTFEDGEQVVKWRYTKDCL